MGACPRLPHGMPADADRPTDAGPHLPTRAASQEKWLPTVCTSMAVWGPY